MIKKSYAYGSFFMKYFLVKVDSECELKGWKNVRLHLFRRWREPRLPMLWCKENHHRQVKHTKM